ncbi:hypothetical protein [Microbacterium sp.]|uniref:hypothetical protein n=1 Tax=Microbacterium sp. TaxID=51671 RepID=UPI00333EBA40
MAGDQQSRPYPRGAASGGGFAIGLMLGPLIGMPLGNAGTGMLIGAAAGLVIGGLVDMVAMRKRPKP